MSVATILTAAPDPAAIHLLPNPGEGTGTGMSDVTSEPDLLRYLSASRLKCWQSCRRQFYYRYVERIVVPTAPALFIGRQIHEVLRQWNWAKWRSEPLSPEQLQAALTQGWARDAAAEFIPWKTPDDEAIARDQAWLCSRPTSPNAPSPRTNSPRASRWRSSAVLATVCRRSTASSTWCGPAGESSITSRRPAVQ